MNNSLFTINEKVLGPLAKSVLIPLGLSGGMWAAVAAV